MGEDSVHGGVGPGPKAATIQHARRPFVEDVLTFPGCVDSSNFPNRYCGVSLTQNSAGDFYVNNRNDKDSFEASQSKYQLNCGQDLLPFYFIIAFSILFEALSWIIRGGLFSIVSTIIAAHEMNPSVDLDQVGLHGPITVALSVIAIYISIYYNIDHNKRWIWFTTLVIIIGGGFIIPGTLEPPISTKILATQGYSRCPSHDRFVGHGKGSVWLQNYVLARETCMIEQPSARKPKPA